MTARPNRLWRFALTVCLLCTGVLAQPERTDPTNSILDTVSRWLSFLGEKTEDLIAPRFGRLDENGGVDWRGLTTSARDFDQSYPVRPNVVISVSSEFGEIRVDTWDNPVVQVRAEISVGAETADVADEIADAIGIMVTEAPERVGVSTKYPDTRNRGKVAVEVNYALTVPASASVLCSNNFGDTIISGIGGRVGVESRFGVVDLRNLAGPVTVKAIGDFPLNASGLRQGGSFELRGTQAEFSAASGALKVSNFMGTAVLRELAPECDLDVTNESGPIHVYVPENSKPDVSASALFGGIQSDIAMEQMAQGDLTFGRITNVEAHQQVSLHTSFDNVYVHQEGLKPAPAPAARTGGEYVTRGAEETAQIAEGTQVIVKAILGDVRIEGVDSDRLELKATKVVRIQSQANAQAAIEALSLRVEPLDGKLFVTTALRDNMEALGCTHYRVDLEIRVPRTAALKVNAESGFTSIAGMGSSIEVEQAKGNVALEHCKRDSGPFDISNQSGDVSVSDCQGPMTLTTQQGAVKTVNVYGKQTISAALGKTLIESPKGEVAIRNRGGDVSILALDGVQGNYSVQVEKGNLNLVIPPSADAALWVTAKNGEVYSSVKITGTVERQLRTYNGQLNGGQFRVELSAESGNIYIDGPTESPAS